MFFAFICEYALAEEVQGRRRAPESRCLFVLSRLVALRIASTTEKSLKAEKLGRCSLVPASGRRL